MTDPTPQPALDAPVFSALTEPAQSKSQTHLIPILFALQQELDPIRKTEKNEHLRTTYADLNAVWNAIREPLKEHGLLVIQEPQPYARGALITTTLVHVESMEWRSSTTYIPARKADAQAFGSAMSYARRYSLLTVLSLMTTDDDGHAATVVATQPATPAHGPKQVKQTDDERGWQLWGQGKLLQLQGCETEEQLINCWKGMQTELKKAPAEVRAGITSAKDQQKAKLTPETGLPDLGDPGADVPF